MSCPDCFSGHAKTGNPTGKEVTLYGRKTYVAEPSSPSKGTIVIVPDAFGWEFINNRLLVDHYAHKTECKVLLPDFMNGTSAPVWLLDSMYHLGNMEMTPSNWLLQKPYHFVFAVPTFIKFIYRHAPSKALSRVETFLEALRADEPATPIGAAGFCWGGNITFSLARADKPLIDVMFSAHPSMLAMPKDAEGIKVPTAIAIGDKDTQLDAKGVKTLKETFAAQKDLKWEVEVYADAGHGFAVRADPGRDVGKQAEKAEDQASKWFVDRFAELKK